ncbi:chymotrypsinogen A-like isoform X2 [Biomphalaria glabrata]|uniref:Chymotrypsinogen A-like isoform X2 n=1 Tax=Biomphalaria glabrata TaxID=6526 RepID=A0A9W2ZI80_BIOGL|nr:chymotrypsinogen A-like isoform X2 [Biomphalaria glabrata]
MNVFIFTGLIISLIHNNMADERARKRIINGQDAQLFDVPSQVAIMKRLDTGYFDQWCGAVLVAWNKVVKLADEIDRYVNTSCIMSGWGYTNKTLWTKTNRLQKAITMIISNTYCKTFWPQFSEALDKKLFLCVYNKNGTSGQPNSICSGDSGGPLYCGPNKDILVGTAVGNESKCKGMLAQVFTNVATYKDWLADKL